MIILFCQTPIQLQVGVDFVLPLSQEQQEKQEEQPKTGIRKTPTQQGV